MFPHSQNDVVIDGHYLSITCKILKIEMEFLLFCFSKGSKTTVTQFFPPNILEYPIPRFQLLSFSAQPLFFLEVLQSRDHCSTQNV